MDRAIDTSENNLCFIIQTHLARFPRADLRTCAFACLHLLRPFLSLIT